MVFVETAELFIYIWFSVLLIGTIGSRVSVRKTYEELKNRPSIAPNPSRAGLIFGLVWFALYTLEAGAAYRIRLLGAWTSNNVLELSLFVVLQVIMAFFSLLFVYNKWLAAFDVLVSLLLAIVVMILFFTLDTLAGALMVPLVLWLIYATILSFWIASTNSENFAARLARRQCAGGKTMRGGVPTQRNGKCAPLKSRIGRTV